ncbi:YeeE/YedE family protein [Robiginitomaculum antarcticum]|uniref:YeeE/YedE family protein n=1 Tax=Robiginitomaculum antarcticum TaxID=437507 RepID=UPI0003725299|nr:YeeE/YedE family protein [Robiginitomaculum antarcticum]
MNRSFSALIAGLLFGAGLTISAMVNPAKVIAFLDIFGNWDPSLAFVMGGALLVTIPGYFVLRKKEKPLLEEQFFWPEATQVDRKLIIGATLFGMGWGLSGLCPGPAIASVGAFEINSLIFLGAMLTSAFGYRYISQRNASRP